MNIHFSSVCNRNLPEHLEAIKFKFVTRYSAKSCSICNSKILGKQ